MSFIIFGGFIVVLAAIIIFFLQLSKSFNEWSNDLIVERGEKVIITDLEDRFVLTYEVVNFPDYATDIYIYEDELKDRKVLVVGRDGGFVDSKFVMLINTASIKCYEAFDSLIFKVNNGEFYGVEEIGIPSYELNDQNKEIYEGLLKVTGQLVSNNDWKWIKICGKFLLNHDDEYMKQTLERYAKGNFTQEELDFNSLSDLTKEDMQKFAKSTLADKGIVT